MLNQGHKYKVTKKVLDKCMHECYFVIDSLAMPHTKIAPPKQKAYCWIEDLKTVRAVLFFFWWFIKYRAYVPPQPNDLPDSKHRIWRGYFLLPLLVNQSVGRTVYAQPHVN